jgi:hypothetical protein
MVGMGPGSLTRITTPAHGVVAGPESLLSLLTVYAA